ncbi:hypothetical protein QQX98_000936 [Neonectria punicea]|uniref:FAD-binding FR-type domain-containing protein n=1 Tax=Neonectria punicea TaxID=979145 RepID=A0ABR1HRH7_9HYPO
MTVSGLVPKPVKPRQLVNEWLLKLYACALCGLILLFLVLHWARLLAIKYRWSTSSPLRRLPGFRIVLAACRASRRCAARQVPVYPSLGHAVLIAVYLIMNVVLSFVYVDFSKLSNLASRLGWVAAANITLSVFFGLRNTPLALFSTYSYNRLNVLHRAVGYIAIGLTALHAVVYMVHFNSRHRWNIFIERPNLEGSIAGVGMLVLLLGTLRQIGYEIFYLTHIVGCIITILFTALHRPFWIETIPIIMVVAAVLWGLDRLIRAMSLVSNLHKNEAAIYPLQKGGIRLLFKRPAAKAVPGSHCFVWIPGIRAFEGHPFTVVSNTSSGLELIIKTYDGFTKDLYAYACLNPGTSIQASIEGTYGSFPNLAHYDRIILVAGGSGAAFTFPLVNSLLRDFEPGSTQLVDFIWAVKEKENLSWFAKHLDDLSCYPTHVSVALHVTSDTRAASTHQPNSPTADGDEDPLLSRETYGTFKTPQYLNGNGGLNGGTDHNKQQNWALEPVELNDHFKIKYEKLNVEDTVCELMESIGVDERVLIAGCGPPGLMKDIKTVAGRCIRTNGPSIDIHCEDFGW